MKTIFSTSKPSPFTISIAIYYIVQGEEENVNNLILSEDRRMIRPFTPPHNSPEIIAHRGASYDAPENTLAAFKLAWRQKADGIKGDFRLTKDEKIVCIHDATTGRTAGLDLPVVESEFKELRELDIGSWKGNEWAGERIPSIAEVFSLVPADKKIFIEIKCGPEIVEPLGHAIVRSRLKPEQVVVISFDGDVIYRTKKQIPHIKTLWLSNIQKDRETGERVLSIDHILRVLNESNADGLSINASPITGESSGRSPVSKLASALLKRKMEFHVWNVNDIDTALYFLKLGAASMTTDHPKRLREKLTPPLPSTLSSRRSYPQG
jgi:glycerophosphoryl diester phosphodiesterase